MSKLWIDATNLLKWQGNPVGVVRVEAELVKYFLNRDAAFCYFDDKNGLFVQVELQTLRNAINSLQESKKSIHSVENHSLIGKSKKAFFNYLKDVLPDSSISFLDELSEKISDLYYQLILLQIKTLKVAGYIRKITSLRSVSTQQHCFDHEDHFLSAGLHWDSDCLVVLRSLKSKYRLEVTTICYDLIPVLFPEFYLNKVKPLFEQHFKSLSLVSDKILCISKNTQTDLNTWLKKKNLPTPPTEVVTLGSDFLNAKKIGETSELINEIIKKNYLLYVSTIEVRKNHWVLIKAYEKLINSGITKLPKLVFVGRIGWGVKDLLEYLRDNQKLSNYIIHLDNIVDAELIKLYKHSLFCLYPSKYEGWGLPVVEALDHGKFSLCANNSSIPEVGGGFVEYASTNSIEDWADKITHYIDSPSEITKKEKAISLDYQSKNWANFCQQIEKIAT